MLRALLALLPLPLVAFALLGGCGSDDEPATTTADGGTSSADGSVTGADGGKVTLEDGGTVTPPTGEDAGALIAPGQPCLLGDGGAKIASSCADNPLLPTCYQCVDLSTNENPTAPVCAYWCRIGKQDCPQGQTCVKADNASRTSQQDCRNLTGNTEPGYCK